MEGRRLISRYDSPVSRFRHALRANVSGRRLPLSYPPVKSHCYQLRLGVARGGKGLLEL
jgi:hypothetical protein